MLATDIAAIAIVIAACVAVPLPVATAESLAVAGVTAGTAPSIVIAPGVGMPMVVLGTGSGQKGVVEKATDLWLREAGGVGIDTAYDYNDEGDIAKGIAASGVARSAIFLESKIPCGTYAKSSKDIDANLQQLGVKSVDLMLMHFQCRGGQGTVADSWRALEDALSAGKTRAIGVSHFVTTDLTELMKTAKVKPAVNQCSLSVSQHDDTTIEYCRQQGITYQSFSPLCGGFNGSSCTMHGGKNVMTVPEVIAIAATHKVTAAQVGLKWVVQQGLPLATAVWELGYMREDLDLWSWGNLTAAEMKTLAAVATSD